MARLMDDFDVSECDFPAATSKPYTVIDLHRAIEHVYEGIQNRTKYTVNDVEFFFQ